MGDASSNPQGIQTGGGIAWFNATDGGSTRVWCSDGTPSGTHKVLFSNASTFPTAFFAGCDGRGYLVGYIQEGSNNRWVLESADAASTTTTPLLNWVQPTGTSFTPRFVNHTYADGNTQRPAVIFAGGGPSKVMDVTGGGVNAAIDIPYGESVNGLYSIPAGAINNLFTVTPGCLYESGEMTLSLGTRRVWPSVFQIAPLSANKIAMNRSSMLWLLDRIQKRYQSNSISPNSFAFCQNRLYVTEKDTHQLYCVTTDDANSTSTVSLVPNMTVALNDTKELLTASGRNLFLVRDNSSTGDELWRIDSNQNQTLLLTMTKENFFGTYSAILAMAPLNDDLVFLLKNIQSKNELWKSDGTAAGTQRIHLFGTNTSTTAEVVNAGNRVFLTGNDIQGVEPWVSDGAVAGSRQAANINQSAPTVTVYNSCATNGQRGFLTARSGDAAYLLTSDGTKAGTENLGDIGQPPYYPQVARSNVSLTGVSNSQGIFLMTSTPIYGGGATGSYYAMIDRMFYYHTASKSLRSIGIWGRLINLARVADVYTLKLLGDLLFISDQSENGYWDLWASNGSSAARKMNVNATSDPDVIPLETLEQSILFAANDGVHGRELWRSNGQQSGTYYLKDLPGDGIPTPSYEVVHYADPKAARLGNKIYYAAKTSAAGTELWRSNGTQSGTVQVRDINPGTGDSSPTQFSAAGTKVVFSAFEPSVGIELFATDGTTSGTTLLKDIVPGSGYSSPTFRFAHNGIAYYTATTPAEGTELWRTDGTPQGTYMLKDLDPGNGTNSFYRLSGIIGNKAFFIRYAQSYGLFVTDGTMDGTQMLVPLQSSSIYYSNSVVIGNYLYFRSYSSLYKTDGTLNGTQLLSFLPSVYELMGSAGSKLLFYGTDANLYAYDTTNNTDARQWEGYE